MPQHQLPGPIDDALHLAFGFADQIDGADSWDVLQAPLRAHPRLVAPPPVGGFCGCARRLRQCVPDTCVLGGDFMPDFNRGEYQVSFKATPGATLRETTDRAQQVVAKLRAMPAVEYTYTTIGEAGSQYRPVTEGTTYVKLKPHSGGTFSEVLREARHQIEQVPGLTFGLTEAGAFGQKPIQISVRGPEIDALDRISRSLVAAMRDIPGTADIENSLEKSKPELRVQVDRQRASDLGIPVSMIAATMQAGVVGQVATTIQDGAGDNHNVRVRLRADQRRFGNDLERLSIATDKDDEHGDKILRPLREVANVYPGPDHRPSGAATSFAKFVSRPTPTDVRCRSCRTTSTPRRRG